MSNILFGVVCLDIYTNTGLIRPGCGILHNAYHLQQLNQQPLLITRIGQTQSAPFLDFLRAHRIAFLPELIVTPGQSASIDIAIQESGEAIISNFTLGVWQEFRLQPAEETRLAQAANVHTVLAAGVITEFRRLLVEGRLEQAFVSADFLSFNNFTLDSFAQIIDHIDLAFIGWKRDLSHPTVAAIRDLVSARQVLVVMTLGERGIQVFNSLEKGNFQERFFEVDKVAVQGNTNGCGDAFIAYFLAEYWQSRNLEKAIAQGKIGGAKATAWNFALPDEAYLD